MLKISIIVLMIFSLISCTLKSNKNLFEDSSHYAVNSSVETPSINPSGTHTPDPRDFGKAEVSPSPPVYLVPSPVGAPPERLEGVQDYWYLDPLRGWAIVAPFPGASKTLYRTVDGGKTWEIVRDRLPYESLRTMWMDEQNGWLLGQFWKGKKKALVYYRTSDGGRSWVEKKYPSTSLEKLLDNPESSIQSECVWNIDSQNFFLTVAVEYGELKNLFLYHSSDAERTWSQPQRADIGQGPRAAGRFGDIEWDFSNTSEWILRRGSDVWVSADAGRHWKHFADSEPPQ